VGAAYNAVSVGTSATSILAANKRRTAYELYNNGTATVFWGSNNSVTTSNGMALKQGERRVVTRETASDRQDEHIYTGAIFGIVASGTVNVRYWEEDDT